VRNAISGVRGRASVLGKAIEYQVELADRHNTLTVTSSREISVYEVGSRVASVPKRNAVQYFRVIVRVHAGAQSNTATL